MSVASVSVERGCLRLLLNRARSRYRYRPRFSLFFCLSGVRLGDDAAWRAQSGKPRFDGASPYQTARPGVAKLNAKR